VELRSFLWEGAADSTAIGLIQLKLHEPHAELETLCLDPSGFKTEKTFREVSTFNGRLSKLRHLMDEDPSLAKAYWKDELHAQYHLSLSQIAGELNRLTRER
jgi:hypothetical protein